MKENTIEPSTDLSELIEMVKELIKQTDEKIREATRKSKTAESVISMV